MSSRNFWQYICSPLVLGVILGNTAPANAISFSVDPASPAIAGTITPDDVLDAEPTVSIQGTDLGLQDNFSDGNYDNLNAFSYGRDPIRGPLFFSVDRLVSGLQATNVYQTFPPNGTNQLFIDGKQQLGLTPDSFGDDLDALELQNQPAGSLIYFSIDSLSVSVLDRLAKSSDILSSSAGGSFKIFAGASDIGLGDGDDIDALALWDDFEPGTLNPGRDRALFSLSAFSPSASSFSPAAILSTDFDGKFSLFASASDLGLSDGDELNALDTAAIPEPLTILGTATAVGFGAFFKGKQNKKKRQKDSEAA